MSASRKGARTSASSRPVEPTNENSDTTTGENLTRAIVTTDGRVLIELPDGTYRLAESQTDWARQDAMSEAEVERLAAASQTGRAKTREDLAVKIMGLGGWSGAGKTTLLSKLIPELVRRGLTVSTMKHAHHGFDVDQPGKDSYVHRQAGATEVLIASEKRWAL